MHGMERNRTRNNSRASCRMRANVLNYFDYFVQVEGMPHTSSAIHFPGYRRGPTHPGKTDCYTIRSGRESRSALYIVHDWPSLFNG